MRKIFLMLFLLFVLASCSEETTITDDSSEASIFEEIERNYAWIIVYHKETKVMYAVSNGSANLGTFTLLVDSEGKPMLYQ